MIQMNVSHTDTTWLVFYTTGSSYKDEQYLPCCGEKETTQPEQISVTGYTIIHRMQQEIYLSV
jgi:hypothetical protein